MGSKLYATFRSAGLPSPEMMLAGRVEGGRESPIYDWLTGVLRSLLPVAGGPKGGKRRPGSDRDDGGTTPKRSGST